jgi:hypothetical protein
MQLSQILLNDDVVHFLGHLFAVIKLVHAFTTATLLDFFSQQPNGFIRHLAFSSALLGRQHVSYRILGATSLQIRFDVQAHPFKKKNQPTTTTTTAAAELATCNKAARNGLNELNNPSPQQLSKWNRHLSNQQPAAFAEKSKSFLISSDVPLVQALREHMA